MQRQEVIDQLEISTLDGRAPQAQIVSSAGDQYFKVGTRDVIARTDTRQRSLQYVLTKLVHLSTGRRSGLSLYRSSSSRAPLPPAGHVLKHARHA